MALNKVIIQTNKQKDVLEIVLHLEWNSRIPALILIACLAWLQNKLLKLQRHLFYPPHRIIRKEINPEYALKGLMLKLKLQYFGHLMRRADSLERTQMLGKIEGKGEGGERRWDGWMASLTQWTGVWANSGRQWRTGKPGVLQSRGRKVRHKQLNNKCERQLFCLLSPLTFRSNKSRVWGAIGKECTEEPHVRLALTQMLLF